MNQPLTRADYRGYSTEALRSIHRRATDRMDRAPTDSAWMTDAYAVQEIVAVLAERDANHGVAA